MSRKRERSSFRKGAVQAFDSGKESSSKEHAQQTRLFLRERVEGEDIALFISLYTKTAHRGSDLHNVLRSERLYQKGRGTDLIAFIYQLQVLNTREHYYDGAAEIWNGSEVSFQALENVHTTYGLHSQVQKQEARQGSVSVFAFALEKIEAVLAAAKNDNWVHHFALFENANGEERILARIVYNDNGQHPRSGKFAEVHVLAIQEIP